MPVFLAALIDGTLYVLILLVLAEVIVSNVIAFGGKLSPYHPAVVTLRRIVNPLLAPIRRILPPQRIGGWDFSPMILTLFLYLLRNLIHAMH